MPTGEEAKHDTKRNARARVRKTGDTSAESKNVSFFLLAFPSEFYSLHSDAIDGRPLTSPSFPASDHGLPLRRPSPPPLRACSAIAAAGGGGGGGAAGVLRRRRGRFHPRVLPPGVHPQAQLLLLPRRQRGTLRLPPSHCRRRGRSRRCRQVLHLVRFALLCKICVFFFVEACK